MNDQEEDLRKEESLPDQDEILDRVHALEASQAGQAATMAGAQATQAALQAANMATMVIGSVSLIVGIFLGMAIAKAR